MMPVASTAPDNPAARANGTVRPSDIPITMSRTASVEVKCFSMCGVCGIGRFFLRSGCGLADPVPTSDQSLSLFLNSHTWLQLQRLVVLLQCREWNRRGGLPILQTL